MGASVGAINAAALACNAHEFNEGVLRITDFWRSVATSDVYRTDPFAILKGGGHWVVSLTPLGSLGISHPRSLLDNSPLAQLLRKNIDRRPH